MNTISMRKNIINSKKNLVCNSKKITMPTAAIPFVTWIFFFTQIFNYHFQYKPMKWFAVALAHWLHDVLNFTTKRIIAICHLSFYEQMWTVKKTWKSSFLFHKLNWKQWNTNGTVFPHFQMVVRRARKKTCITSKTTVI